ncbi:MULTISPECIES: CAP-associated domain-containing protein [Sutcliffiella]|uniref:Serine protease n=1 Tax=Sutcliffiella cohnii TaxID=33932 RepID=A0A223KNE5_9BACI|nr:MULTISPECIES: CAP-associated domain-containing protein [Sutcliffiella]AST90926.1 serine protease [Sutcliffiella cohnii]WBL16715.1 CAP-associated domain-containing protein [Sutcliffiella sp. NC1]
MKRFILLVVIVFLGYVSKPLWEEPVQQLIPSSIWDSVHQTVEQVKEDPNVNIIIDNLTERFNSLLEDFDTKQLESNDTNIATPELLEPTEEMFSIHNIELGDSRAEVEQIIGHSPKRSTLNEYGVHWDAYHENYQNFIMVAYDEEDIVRGLYTNQDLIASSTEIMLGSSMELVREQLGKPETIIPYRLFHYAINSNGEYDVFHLDNSYVTIFYDQHENDTVTAIKIIDEELERGKNTLYSEPSEQLQVGFEYQLFDLTNATRSNHNLPLLSWDDQVKETARKHSMDMAENQYFSHTNLKGQSPFDRMEEDNIPYTTAGENLAYGQISSIFAHEGLMNSLGHRKNILQERFRKLGVGVAFNNESQPYYTKKYFSN